MRGTCRALLVCIVHKFQSFQRNEAQGGTSMPCAAANAFEVGNLWMLFDKIGMNLKEILGVGEKRMTPNVTALFSESDGSNPSAKKWLSGNEVLQETGISKRDLIRFIQLRVLPKSMMRVSAAGGDGRRKKSYFSASILGHVAMLKRLRDEGHSVEEIASEMREAAEGNVLPDKLYPEEEPSAEPTAAASPQEGIPLQARLLTESIATAAFFVDADLRIKLVAPVEVRAERIAKRDGMGMEDAVRHVKERDAENRERYKKLYDIDIYDESVFDAVFSAEMHTPEQLKEMALVLIKKKGGL